MINFIKISDHPTKMWHTVVALLDDGLVNHFGQDYCTFVAPEDDNYFFFPPPP